GSCGDPTKWDENFTDPVDDGAIWCCPVDEDWSNDRCCRRDAPGLAACQARILATSTATDGGPDADAQPVDGQCMEGLGASGSRCCMPDDATPRLAASDPTAAGIMV